MEIKNVKPISETNTAYPEKDKEETRKKKSLERGSKSFKKELEECLN